MSDTRAADEAAIQAVLADSYKAWVDRYMTAFERADVEGLKRLLTDDAR